jgi:hypothetical protein
VPPRVLAAALVAPSFGALTSERRDPSEGPLHQLLSDKLEDYLDARHERPLPGFVVDTLRGYLRCGVLRYGIARFRCDDCAKSRLLALSCKRGAFCPRCVGRKMADQAKHLLENVLPPVPFRQWVVFLQASPPTLTEMDALVAHIKHLVVQLLKDLGLDPDEDDDPDPQLLLGMGELYEDGVFNTGARKIRHGKPRGLATFQRLKAHDDGFDLDAQVTHIRMTCERFIDRLVALVPPRRVNTLLYGGLFAANARLRTLVVAYQRPGVTPRKRTRPANPTRPRNTPWADLCATALVWTSWPAPTAAAACASWPLCDSKRVAGTIYGSALAMGQETCRALPPVISLGSCPWETTASGRLRGQRSWGLRVRALWREVAFVTPHHEEDSRELAGERHDRDGAAAAGRYARSPVAHRERVVAGATHDAPRGLDEQASELGLTALGDVAKLPLLTAAAL